MNNKNNNKINRILLICRNIERLKKNQIILYYSEIEYLYMIYAMKFVSKLKLHHHIIKIKRSNLDLNKCNVFLIVKLLIFIS